MSPIILVAESAGPKKIGEVAPMKKGYFTCTFTLLGVDDTLQLPNVQEGVGYSEGDIFDLPFATGHLFVSPFGGGINFKWKTEAGEAVLAQVKFSYLKGDQPYHLAIGWDLERGSFDAYLNGVEQGDPLHGKSFETLVPATWIKPIRSDGDLYYEGRAVARIKVSDVERHAGELDAVRLAERVAAMNLPPVSGEFRRTYTESLPLVDLKLKEVYSCEFGDSDDWIEESDLLDTEGNRVRIPESGQWVLEGDYVERSYTANGTRFVSRRPEDKKLGSWVFWHNQELPEDFLIEYSFTPEQSDSGLNILFFNAKGTDGQSIFDKQQPVRRGQFGQYIIGSINNYHVSPWATDENRLRKSSNLRKNSGFKLVAIGDDRIGQHAAHKAHLVRVFKQGGQILVEADGILVMEYTDPGTVYGPVYSGGIAGIRFMAHTRSVTMHTFTVYRIEE